MDISTPQITARSLVGVPLNEKWELLKPELERLYLEEKFKLAKIMEIMKSQYGFDANDGQYKYQFGRKWGWKKNVPGSKMEAICELGKTRAALGKNMIVKYKGKEVDSKKIRRYTKEEARKGIVLRGGGSSFISGSRQSGFGGFVLPFPTCVFLNWNLPYGALRSSIFWDIDQPSPLGPFVSTPPTLSDVSMGSTPPGDTAASPQNMPSLLLSTLKKKTATDRARLFIQGKYDDLYKSLDRSERVTTSTWLYQFWLFAFRTAKYWGRGPRNWTADKLGFTEGERSTLSPNTPGMLVDSPKEAADIQKPSLLCHWSIHGFPEDYSPEPQTPMPPSEQQTPSPLPEEHPDPEEGLLSKWPKSWKIPPFEERLKNGLESNDFSSFKASQLPLAISHVAKAAGRSPNELLVEALGFSIISRNNELVNDSLQKVQKAKADISQLFPLHLATSYLDGSTQCCNILFLLCYRLESHYKEMSTNSLGHTVLDNLMITVLKAHTSVSPRSVDEALKKEARFTGEEVDICGRWDADSDCFRTLLAGGRSSIPPEWKHPFCHTSVQAVCHSIETIGYFGHGLGAPSGLFIKRCSYCGLKLQLFPIHTLVLIAFHLAQFGREGEDLFGILACLLCLLCNGVNPSITAPVSFTALLGEDSGDNCTHEDMTPAELAKKVPAVTIDRWPHSSRTGWQILCRVLDIAKDDWTNSPEESDSGAESLDEGAVDNSASNSDSMHIDKTELRAQTPERSMPEDYMDMGGKELRAQNTEGNLLNDNSARSYEGGGSPNWGSIGYDCYGGNFMDIPGWEPPSGAFEVPLLGKGQTDGKSNRDAMAAGAGFDQDCGDHLYYRPSSFRKSSCLGHIWAAIQAEFLTYRRLELEDSWNSENFDMEGLLKSLNSGGPISIGLLEEKMMNPYCRCGRFGDHEFVTRREALCEGNDDEYLSQLDYWDRITFIGSRWEWI